jgi:ribonuclease HII
MPDLSHERAARAAHGGPVAGLDEVGRGPWAGPVVACAVVLTEVDAPTGGLPPDVVALLDDSKKLTTARRDRLFDRLRDVPHGLGVAEVREIDAMNILQASLLAMRRALAAAPVAASCALVDGNRDPGLGVPTELMVKGDGRSVAIAAASVIAKVTRDRVMANLAAAHPGYGWESNMGYGTKAHAEALTRLGVTPHHRRSFAPVRAVLEALV